MSAPRRAGPRTEAELVLPVGAEGVVFLALVRIGEHLVGLVDLFEACLGGLIARIHVGMIFARQLAIRLFDLVACGALLDSEDFVIVFVVHRCSIVAA
jgi:hypothetical protein